MRLLDGCDQLTKTLLGDVDPTKSRVAVVQTLQVDGRFDTPKTHASRATVFLPVLALKALQRQRADQNKRKLRLARDWQDFDLVFDRGDGAPVDTRSISRRFSATARRGGFDLPFHGLRHAHASLMHGSGTDLKTISENMRHSTIAITADLYTHIDPETHRQAADRLDAYLTPFLNR